MPRPMTCSLRRTRPMGPMALCSDLGCYEVCVKFTREFDGQRMEHRRAEERMRELLK